MHQITQLSKARDSRISERASHPPRSRSTRLEPPSYGLDFVDGRSTTSASSFSAAITPLEYGADRTMSAELAPGSPPPIMQRQEEGSDRSEDSAGQSPEKNLISRRECFSAKGWDDKWVYADQIGQTRQGEAFPLAIKDPESKPVPLRMSYKRCYDTAMKNHRVSALWTWSCRFPWGWRGCAPQMQSGNSVPDSKDVSILDRLTTNWARISGRAAESARESDE